MPYDQKLALRTRDILKDYQDVSEFKMFGGIAFKASGRMFGGITGQDLIVRLGTDVVLDDPHLRPMDFTGRPLKGIFFVSPEGVQTKMQLRRWLDRAIRYVGTLPEK